MNEAALMAALKEHGGVAMGGVFDFFDAVWASVDTLWRFQQRCGLKMAWETVPELLELLCAWLHARHFHAAERLRQMVSATVRQIELEWGSMSEDGARLRGLW